MTIVDDVKDILGDQKTENKNYSKDEKKVLTQITSIEEERDQIKSRRDKLNNLVNELFAESKKFRSERDKLNQKVQDHKSQREKLAEKIEKSNDNDQKRKLQEKADKHHQEVQNLAKLSQDKHHKMVEKIKEAKGQNSIAKSMHYRVVQLNRRIRKLKRELKKIR